MDPDHPIPAHERGALLAGLDDATMDTLLRLAGPGSATPALLVELRHLGGALGRPARGRDAVGARDAAFSLFAVGVLAPPVADIMGPAVDGLVAELAQHGTGRAFVNFHGTIRSDDDRARCWSDETYRRLQQTKQAHDPANTFRFGHARRHAGLKRVARRPGAAAAVSPRSRRSAAALRGPRTGRPCPAAARGGHRG